MRASFASLVVVLSCAAAIAQPSDDPVKLHFKSDFYTVTWGEAPTYDPGAELEVGDGSGHGFTLRWLRFQPGKDGVDVLSISLDEGRKGYSSKWPPDRAPLTVERARMKPEAYAALLRQLAVVDAAKLKPVEMNSVVTSSGDFWVSCRLTANKKELIDQDWAGYWGSREAVKFAKPQAAVKLAEESVKEIDFKDHTMTDEERAWASAKFTRDWAKFKGLDFHWWVRERYLITIGVVGDQSALPVLREILAADPPKGKPWDASDGRCVYYAINAVTRLTKQDVRDKPIEEMDIEKTRLKVLEMLKDRK